jgi:DNA uptake protein ComE-like DNA-binding protein
VSYRVAGARSSLAAAVLATAGYSERAQQRAGERWRNITGESRDVGARVDLNTASEKELAKLPGITDDDASRIVANRPYGDKRGLLRKSVSGQGKYDKVQDSVYGSQPNR